MNKVCGDVLLSASAASDAAESPPSLSESASTPPGFLGPEMSTCHMPNVGRLFTGRVIVDAAICHPTPYYIGL
jgi:hypothetical protein